MKKMWEKLRALPAKVKAAVCAPLLRLAERYRALPQKHRRAIIAVCVLCGLTAAVAGGYRMASSLRTLPADAINAVQVDGTYLVDNGNLLVYTDGRVDLQYLRRNLKTADNQLLTVSPVTDSVFSVRFAQKLEKDSTVQLQLRSPRGYTTAREFTVSAGKPQPQGSMQARLICAGTANQVDIYAPVLLHFSQPIPQEQLRTNLEFSSGVKTAVRMVDNIAVISPQTPLAYNTRYSISVASGLQVGGKTLPQAFSSQFTTVAAPAPYTQQLQNIQFEQPVAAPVSALTVAPLKDSDLSQFDPTGSLTLILSDSVSPDTLRSYISFAPTFNYTLDVQDNVAVIRPSASLGFAAKYKLTIGDGLESENGQRLAKPYELELTTAARSMRLTLTNQASNVTDVSQPLKLEFALHNPKSDYLLTELTLYRMDNYEQYRKVLSLAEVSQDFSLLELEHTTEILRNGLNAVTLDNPGKGIYMVKATTNDPETGLPLEFYKCLNVTDLAVYLQTANDRTTIWVNSTVGAALPQGMTAELADRTSHRVLATGRIGADGSCELTYDPNIPDNMKHKQGDGVLTIFDAQGKVIYADTTMSIAPGSEKPENTPRYYTFSFTDRTLYRPTDTISFWGFVKPYMLNEEPLPKTVRVHFDRGGLDLWVDVPLKEDGTFIGELPIDKVVSAQYDLQFYFYYPDREETEQIVYLGSEWLEVKDFEKPTFMLTTRTTKPLFSTPEQVEIEATLTFYDGTPVPNYPLELDIMNTEEGNLQEVKTGTTDAKGTVIFRFRPDSGIGTHAATGPITGHANVVMASDGEVIKRYTPYSYQSSSLVTEATGSVSGSQAVDVTLRTNHPRGDITAEQLKALRDAAEYYWQDNDQVYESLLYRTMAGSTADVGVKAQVEVTYTDLLGNNRHERFPVKAVTQGGIHRESFKLEVPCDPKFNVGVVIQISCVDDNLNLISTGWSYNTIERKVEQPEEAPRVIKGYSLGVKKNGQTVPVQLNYMGYNDLTVDINDLLTLQLCKDGVPVPNEGRIFYQLIQENPIGQQIVTTDTFSLRELFGYAQSVHLIAAYFDGRTVYPVANTAFRLNMNSVELDIRVDSDKEQYRPGETVNLNLHVRDTKGNPISGNVCVSVVDESVFALSEQYLNVLDDLYRNVGFNSVYVQKYTTATGDLREEYTGADGGKGDSGIEAYNVLREKFKDTAYFYDTRTDANGAAQLSFTLPDNITSWRVTTVSIGGSLYGGMDKSNFVTTMPFFSKPVMTSKYLAGDEVVMLTQGHGSLLSDGADISYQIRLQGNDIDRTMTAEGKAYQPVRISLGKLPAGEYTVSSTARYGEYRDTVVLPLTVIPSNLELVVNRTVDPRKLSELGISRFPLSLTFYDKEHEGFYRNLSSLLTHFCNRTDQRLSRYVAKTAMQRYFPPEQIPRYVANSSSFISGIQRTNGGISWYADTKEPSDPVLTAQVLLAIGPEHFSVPRLTKYLQEQIAVNRDSGKDKALLYAALASLQPERTKEIDLLLQKDMPMQERLYYILGLACGGDTAYALELYNRDVVPYLKTAGDSKRMVFSSNEADDRALTAQVWLLTTKLRHPDADAFARTFAEDSWGIDVIFERMAYVSSYQKQIAATTPIRYTQDGVEKELSTGVSGQASMLLTQAELAGTVFTAVPDQLTTRAFYIGEPGDMDTKPSDDISISKTVAALEDGSYLTTLEVKLAEGAPVGSYDISDWVPSNMRFFGMKEQGGARLEQELQKLYFSIYRSSEKDDSFTISYVTRKTFDAETMLDSTYIIHADSGSYNFSERRPMAE